MKHVLVLAVALAIPAPAFSQEICRSISTSWKADGHTYNTRMWTKAEDGCKIIVHKVDGEEIEGVDCDCDLVMDGEESHIPRPDSDRQRGRLTEICLGPTAGSEPETPHTIEMDGPE